MKNIKKYMALATLAIATPALAGEITGTGADTPVNSYRASSICSFSGLNDDNRPTSDIAQSYGMIVKTFGAPRGNYGPGVECRGN